MTAVIGIEAARRPNDSTSSQGSTRPTVSRVSITNGLQNGMYEAMRKRTGGGGSSKGTVVTQTDLKQYQKQFRLLSLLYPALRLTAAADRLLPWQAGHKLIVRAVLA